VTKSGRKAAKIYFCEKNKMRFLSLILLWAAMVPVFAQNSSVQHVITHQRATITTDPSKGEKLYPAWGRFPSADVSVRRILMHVTLACPDSLPCAHWDYMDPITLRRTGGKNGVSRDFELGRMLTPYGSIFTPGWERTWTADVTDFAMLLRDSVEIEYKHTGYETPTVGWALTLDFEIQTGPEVLHPLAVNRMWVGQYRYGDTTNPIAKQITPLSFTVPVKSDLSRFRILHTGHGMDEPRGCSEFCSRWREIDLDGKTVDHTALWKNCGDNALYPQGGTWIYDRALWCPGDLPAAGIVDMPAAAGTHTLSMRMEPYTATANVQATESVSSCLITYQGPFRNQDAAMENIMVPNADPQFRRLNPAGFSPVITFRNLGKEHLRSLSIRYGTEGFAQSTFEWKGDLAFNETTTVALPGEIRSRPGDKRFSVQLTKPNGRKDAWDGDNGMQSHFTPPPVLPRKMVLQFLTNNHPADNTIRLSDGTGKTVYSKFPQDLKPATMYYDTLMLDPGNYALMLIDSAGDGLEFWYESESGYGYLRLLTPDGRLIHAFESDCGDGELLNFSASDEAVVDTTVSQYAFVLFPRRTAGPISLDVHADCSGSMETRITSDGVLVEQHFYKSVKQNRFSYDLSYLPAGRYIMEVFIDGVSRFKRRFNKE
jgi:hypothetical protein